MDPALRERLHRPDLPTSSPATVGELASFSVAQEAAIVVSEDRTKEAVASLDDCSAANQALAAKLGKIKP